MRYSPCSGSLPDRSLLEPAGPAQPVTPSAPSAATLPRNSRRVVIFSVFIFPPWCDLRGARSHPRLHPDRGVTLDFDFARGKESPKLALWLNVSSSGSNAANASAVNSRNAAILGGMRTVLR